MKKVIEALYYKDGICLLFYRSYSTGGEINGGGKFLLTSLKLPI